MFKYRELLGKYTNHSYCSSYHKSTWGKKFLVRHYGQRSNHFCYHITSGSKLHTTAEWRKEVALFCTNWFLNNTLLHERLLEHHVDVSSRNSFQEYLSNPF